VLRPLQQAFPAADHPDLLVGLASPDDAAVWRLDEDRLLVATTDFFTPVVDDGYNYGAIAAANALSDLYAMGATPFLALNVACLPSDLPPAVTADIFRGMADKVKEAGAVIAGGHSLQDDEPKVGLVALGFAPTDALMTKALAKAGDSLVLTKPLGMGVITTALKAGEVSALDIERAMGWMKALNRDAAVLARHHRVQAATDITGFGLLGHAAEVARASAVQLNFEVSAIPVLAGAERYVAGGFVPGGTVDNRSHFSSRVSFADGIPSRVSTLLFDAQTSGGLLIAVPADRLQDFLSDAEKADQPAWRVGWISEGRGVRVEIGEGPPAAAVEREGVDYLSNT
jgi:selenide,water dikinase